MDSYKGFGFRVALHVGLAHLLMLYLLDSLGQTVVKDSWGRFMRRKQGMNSRK